MKFKTPRKAFPCKQKRVADFNKATLSFGLLNRLCGKNRIILMF